MLTKDARYARAAPVLVLSLYAIVLLLLLPRYSLWLDEIIDLRAIRDFNLLSLIRWVPVNAGGVPLGYLTRFASVHLLGYSLFSGRLPSLIFSLAGAAGVFVLARQLKLRFPLLAVLIFCVTPLQFRYAIESRPYSQALAISVWASFVLLQLLEKPTLTRSFVYAALVLAGLYTQPYLLFVAAAHFVWLCLPIEVPHRRRVLWLAGGAITLACLGFLPWYLWTAQLWSESVKTAHLHYRIDGKAALLIVKELVGGGYAGTVLSLAAALWGFNLLRKNERLFWALQLFLPIVLAVAADQVFGYFLAIRQMIFVVVPLSLLAALGIENVARQHRRAALASAAVLVFTFLLASVQFARKPRENWDAAAAILQRSAARGGCVMFAPATQADLYYFLAPKLSQHICSPNVAYAGIREVAVGSYGENDTSAVRAQLLGQGFLKQREIDLHGPKIDLYERR